MHLGSSVVLVDSNSKSLPTGIKIQLKLLVFIVLSIFLSASFVKGVELPECEECPPGCNYVVRCVQCDVHHSGIFMKPESACQSECHKFPEIQIRRLNDSQEVPSVPKATGESTTADSEINLCSHVDEMDNCTFSFTFQINKTSGIVKSIIADRSKTCPDEPKFYSPPVVQAYSSNSRIIFGVICGLVLCLLLILCLGFFKLINNKCDANRF